MCNRCGDQPSEPPTWSRRDVLRRSTGGAIAAAFATGVPWGIGAASTVVKAPYGAGFCSAGLFLAHARQLAMADGVGLELVSTPTFADHITFVGSGEVDVSVTPYTSVIALHDAGAPLRIVAGGGVEGCGIVSQPGLDRADKLEGTRLGTFQMDSLEVMAFDWLRAQGIGMDKITVRYMGSTPEAVEAFKAGGLDWICTIEPYVTALLRDVPGAHRLSDGRDIYGPGYTDCVLTAQTWFIEQRPEALRAIIKALMQAQQAIERQPDQALADLVGPYYKTSTENARIGAKNQPVRVDARDQTDFILERSESLVQMGYLGLQPDRDLFDWTSLEAVITENPFLWESLEHKSQREI